MAEPRRASTDEETLLEDVRIRFAWVLGILPRRCSRDSQDWPSMPRGEVDAYYPLLARKLSSLRATVAATATSSGNWCIAVGEPPIGVPLSTIPEPQVDVSERYVFYMLPYAA
jgi:hypothetical protein